MTQRLSGIAVWDGTRSLGSSVVEWAVEGSDARIAAVGAAEPDPAYAGLTLIPGLIDTHVHLMGYAGSRGADFMTWPLVTRPEEQVFHGLAHAQRALRAGVTTVRDLAASEPQLGLRAGIEEGFVVAPRVLAYGVVGMTGGHNDLFVPPAFPIRGRTADGVDQCRALVRTWARMGMDGIKVTTGGGVLSQGDRSEWRNYTAAELDAIVDEAHALGMLVAAHAHTETAIEVAIDRGVDSVEHGTFTTRAQAERMIAAGMTVAPTLLINEAIAERKVVVSDEAAAKATALVERRDALLADAADAGLDFVLGTDANGYHVKFGDQPDELRAMASLFSWSAERTLVAATSAAAKAIGMGDRLGRIAPGYAADFVLVDGDPANDLSDLTAGRIVAVVSRGRVAVGALPNRGL